MKGWEVSKGEFVFVEDADLEAIAQYDDSRAIEITSFVPLDQIDPVFFDRTYYLAPSSTPAQRGPTSSCSARSRRATWARSAGSSCAGRSISR